MHNQVLPRRVHAINGCSVSHWIRVHGGKRRQGPGAHRCTITVFDSNADVIPLCHTNHVADPVPVLDDDPHAISEHVPLAISEHVPLAISEHVPLAHGQSEHITLTLALIFPLALTLFHCDRRGVTLPHRLVVGGCNPVDVVNPNALGVEFPVS